MILLGRDQLATFYNHALFVIDVTFALYLNAYNSLTIYTALQKQGFESVKADGGVSVLLIVCAWIVYIISIVLYSRAFHSIKPVLFSITTFPVFIRHLSSPGWQHHPPIWLCVCFGYSFYVALLGIHQCLCDIVVHLIGSIRIFHWMYRMYGPTITVVFHWRRVDVPVCMMTLCGTLFFYNVITFLLFSMETLSAAQLFNLSVSLTCNSVLSMTSCCFIIYKLSGYILVMVKHYHHEGNMAVVGDPYNSPDGLREGFGFFFLCLYTGLPSSSTSRKLVLLELIFYLIVSALVRSMFEIVEPILLGLASQQTYVFRKHCRVLSFCAALLATSIYLAMNLYSLKEKIPFITPNVITIAQILAAFVLYLLYVYESLQTRVWEALDDYVYFINGTCKVFEFVVISAVLFYRVCDFSLEWTLFQVVMAILHLYFNIWTPAREGWLSLKQRHQVNQKINALPSASNQEIKELEDVCSICLEELKAAKVTPCKHYFHSLCLRKWLNVQDKCPMCHTALLSF